MALTQSNMLPLGTKAIEFQLPDVLTSEIVTLEKVKGSKGTVVMFICAHCPYVKHIENQLTKTANQYIAKGIGFVAISSNDAATYPEDAPEKLALQAKNNKFPFKYLYDETQEIAKAYQAACTPDFYLFDESLALVYCGRFDASTPGNNQPITGLSLAEAMDDLLHGNQIQTEQLPSIGCNIKWK